MRTALLFPGQGSQFVGMGKDLVEAFPAARERFSIANDILQIPLTSIMFGEGSFADIGAEALRQTDVTQPALYVHSMAAMAVLEASGFGFDAAAGHSLGEYTALAAAGAITYEDGLRTVRLRGSLMAGVGTARLGAMSAVIGLDDETVSNICRRTSATMNGPVVQAANYNSPGQVVISGDHEAVQAASQALTDAGARRVIPLPVSGAFHSPLMEEAESGLAEALEHLDISTPRCPVYLNVDASPSTDPEHIRRRLVEQLTAPVRWSQTITSMREDKVDRFIEIGAGNVLSSLVKRIAGYEVTALTAGKAEEMMTLLDNH